MKEGKKGLVPAALPKATIAAWARLESRQDVRDFLRAMLGADCTPMEGTPGKSVSFEFGGKGYDLRYKTEPVEGEQNVVRVTRLDLVRNERWDVEYARISAADACRGRGYEYAVTCRNGSRAGKVYSLYQRASDAVRICRDLNCRYGEGKYAVARIDLG
jgi:hypothetical protein